MSKDKGAQYTGRVSKAAYNRKLADCDGASLPSVRSVLARASTSEFR
jgi:hypothetical protein